MACKYYDITYDSDRVIENVLEFQLGICRNTYCLILLFCCFWLVLGGIMTEALQSIFVAVSVTTDY